jgi:hypothetical protein
VTEDDTVELVEVNVGVAVESGRVAALDAAADVVREMNSIDLVTVRVPRAAADALADREDVRYVESNGEMGALDKE